MALTPADAKSARAVTLRLLGQTFQQIADSLWPCEAHRPDGRGDCKRCVRMYSDRSAAHKAVQRELTERVGEGLEAREELRRLTLSQIDMLLAAAMRTALDPGDAQRWTATLRATQLLTQRAKLEGLYAPVRIEGTLSTSWEAEIGALVAEIEAQAQGPAAGHPERLRSERVTAKRTPRKR